MNFSFLKLDNHLKSWMSKDLSIPPFTSFFIQQVNKDLWITSSVWRWNFWEMQVSTAKCCTSQDGLKSNCSALLVPDYPGISRHIADDHFLLYPLLELIPECGFHSWATISSSYLAHGDWKKWISVALRSQKMPKPKRAELEAFFNELKGTV